MVQYIGARYVPAFYGDWTANTEYDPLTIVTYNGNSYTSKVKVPAAVGAPDVNAQYWAATGSYNAQVQDLQNKFANFTTQDNDARPVTYVDTANQYFSNVSTAELDQIDLAVPDTTPADVATFNDVHSVMRAYFNPGNDFRFAYRMPENNSFTVQQFLTMLQEEKQIYADNSWVYYTQTPEFSPGVLSTIPLYDPENPSVILNINGKGTSCATAVCNVLYKLGWTDLAGDARYTEARVPSLSLPYYLQSKGWKRIDDFSDIEAGDIVFMNAADYADQRCKNPRHEFVYAGGNMVYDFGSTSLIQSGGVTAMDVTTGTPFVSSIWEDAQITVLGSTSNPAAIGGTTPWIGNVHTGVDGNGKFFKETQLKNPASTARYSEFVTADQDQNFTTIVRPYPLTKTSITHDITTLVKIYEDGRIAVKMNGTPDTTLGAGVNYTMFSFNAFQEFGITYSNDTFTAYVEMTETAKAKIEFVTVGNTTTIHMIPVTAFSDDVHARFDASLI